jgi:hypothetical protein
LPPTISGAVLQPSTAVSTSLNGTKLPLAQVMPRHAVTSL